MRLITILALIAFAFVPAEASQDDYIRCTDAKTFSRGVASLAEGVNRVCEAARGICSSAPSVCSDAMTMCTNVQGMANAAHSTSSVFQSLCK